MRVWVTLETHFLQVQIVLPHASTSAVKEICLKFLCTSPLIQQVQEK